MIITYNSFITSKEGRSLHDCEDSFSINIQNASFAVADGVSQSLLPSLWAKVITSAFVVGKELFFNESNSIIFRPSHEITDEYINRFQKMYDSLCENQKFAVDIRKDRTDFAASTFVGLKIVEQKAEVTCIGDSILFVYSESDNHLFFVSSQSNNILEFDNYPEYVTSKGITKGNIKRVSFDLNDGYILILTDALASWFYNLKDEQIKTTIEQLTSLDSHQSFVKYIEDLRSKKDLKDDDSTIMILHITESNNPEIAFVNNYVDDLDELLLLEYSTENNYLKNENIGLRQQNESLENKLKNDQSIIAQLKKDINELTNNCNQIQTTISKLND